MDRSLAGGEVGIDEGLDLLTAVRAAQVEATNVQKLNDAHLIDEEAVGDNVEIEQAAEHIRVVNRRGETVGPRIFGRAVWVGVDRNAEKGEGIGMLVDELLPHGQLSPALSPTRPHEDEQPSPAVVRQTNGRPIDPGQGEIR